MKRSVFNYLAEIIRDYPNTSKYISDRRQEIIYRHQEEVDENIGGGRQQGKRDESGEKMVITLAMDKRLRVLEEHAHAVEKCLKKCATYEGVGLLDQITYDIIYELYITDLQRYSLEGVAMECHLSVRQARNRREAFFEELAKELGIKTS
ncbi:transcriptional regulator [Ligilactobacillus salitolerans]|uniref:Transcriptional regulator n=1 Tax=Ligilactobacillus salitolerans TaxID=1808352 RepID=A0A401IUK0_9LACO|nr:hypothetical protein [Ligilactobacillus salitolerans]GBG95204.1 transcriptional regulator [Ligilactobacillus salitolerans]